jgi:hypothetical protein
MMQHAIKFLQEFRIFYNGFKNDVLPNMLEARLWADQGGQLIAFLD